MHSIAISEAILDDVSLVGPDHRMRCKEDKQSNIVTSPIEDARDECGTT
jgi:hypothetical protein